MGIAEETFGREIKKARLNLGVSQEELAYLADIHASYVSQLERGIKSPTLDVILRLSRALKKPACEVIQTVEKRIRN